VRETPKAIAAALRAYDPALGLAWNQRDEAWWFTVHGEPAWAYRRRSNGRIVQGDPVLSECLEIVRAADTRVRGVSLFDGMKRSRAKVAASRDRERDRMLGDASKEFRAQVRCNASGPQAYVGPSRVAAPQAQTQGA